MDRGGGGGGGALPLTHFTQATEPMSWTRFITDFDDRGTRHNKTLY